MSKNCYSKNHPKKFLLKKQNRDALLSDHIGRGIRCYKKGKNKVGVEESNRKMTDP